MPGWWVYVLRCRDGSLYTGIARDLDARVEAHARGVASKYTRSRRPVTLVWCEPRDGRPDAARREAEIKRLPREAKLALVAEGASSRGARPPRVARGDSGAARVTRRGGARPPRARARRPRAGPAPDR